MNVDGETSIGTLCLLVTSATNESQTDQQQVPQDTPPPTASSTLTATPTVPSTLQAHQQQVQAWTRTLDPSGDRIVFRIPTSVAERILEQVVHGTICPLSASLLQLATHTDRQPRSGQVGELWLSLSLGKAFTGDAVIISVQAVWIPVRSAGGNEKRLRLSVGAEISTIAIRPVWIVCVTPGGCRCRCVGWRQSVGGGRRRRVGWRCGRVGGCRADRDVIRDRKRSHVDAYVHERRVDPAALSVHAAELQPGAGGVAGVDIELIPLGHRGYYGAERARPFSHIGLFNCDDKVRSWNRR